MPVYKNWIKSQHVAWHLSLMAVNFQEVFPYLARLAICPQLPTKLKIFFVNIVTSSRRTATFLECYSYFRGWWTVPDRECAWTSVMASEEGSRSRIENFKCNICLNKFSKNSDLKAHIFNVHALIRDLSDQLSWNESKDSSSICYPTDCQVGNFSNLLHLDSYLSNKFQN